MTNHFWLVWYRSPTCMGPKHWSLFMTYETDEQALGTAYQVEGNGWGTGQFTTKIARGVQLRGPRGSKSYEGRLYLGTVHDRFHEMMNEYCDAATDMINERNAERVIGDSNCHDWCLLVLQSLEDARCLAGGTYNKARASPRCG